MELQPSQIEIVKKWVKAGDTLAEIQKKLAAEFGLAMTYMEVRFLIDDLQLQLVDKAKPAPAKAAATPVVGGGAPAGKEKEKKGALSGLKSLFGGSEKVEDEKDDLAANEFLSAGKVTVEVDRVVRPGALVSGNATFSDGEKAQWYVDQFGRLVVAPAKKGYQPSQEDMMNFQEELQLTLRRKGF